MCEPDYPCAKPRPQEEGPRERQGDLWHRTTSTAPLAASQGPPSCLRAQACSRGSRRGRSRTMSGTPVPVMEQLPPAPTYGPPPSYDTRAERTLPQSPPSRTRQSPSARPAFRGGPERAMPRRRCRRPTAPACSGCSSARERPLGSACSGRSAAVGCSAVGCSCVGRSAVGCRAGRRFAGECRAGECPAVRRAAAERPVVVCRPSRSYAQPSYARVGHAVARRRWWRPESRGLCCRRNVRRTDGRLAAARQAGAARAGLAAHRVPRHRRTGQGRRVAPPTCDGATWSTGCAPRSRAGTTGSP